MIMCPVSEDRTRWKTGAFIVLVDQSESNAPKLTGQHPARQMYYDLEYFVYSEQC